MDEKDIYAARGLGGPLPEFMAAEPQDAMNHQSLPWDFAARIEAARLAVLEQMQNGRQMIGNIARAFDWLAFLTAHPAPEDDNGNDE
jgi:hypothetical protein